MLQHALIVHLVLKQICFYFSDLLIILFPLDSLLYYDFTVLNNFYYFINYLICWVF